MEFENLKTKEFNSIQFKPQKGGSKQFMHAFDPAPCTCFFKEIGWHCNNNNKQHYY